MRIISTYVGNTKKVRSLEDNDLWLLRSYEIIQTPQSNTGRIKKLDHISGLLQIIEQFIHPPQGIVISVS